MAAPRTEGEEVGGIPERPPKPVFGPAPTEMVVGLPVRGEELMALATGGYDLMGTVGDLAVFAKLRGVRPKLWTGGPSGGDGPPARVQALRPGPGEGGRRDAGT